MAKWLTTPEAGAYLSMRPETLEIWRFRGTGPRYYKLGRLVRYKPEDLDAWMETRGRQSTAEHSAKEAQEQAQRVKTDALLETMRNNGVTEHSAPSPPASQLSRRHA